MPLAGSPSWPRTGGLTRARSQRTGSGNFSMSLRSPTSISSYGHRVSSARPISCSGRAHTPSWSSLIGYGQISTGATCGGRSSSTRTAIAATVGPYPIRELVLVVMVGVLSVAVTFVDEVCVVAVLHVRMAAARSVLMRMCARSDVRQGHGLYTGYLRQFELAALAAAQQCGDRKAERENGHRCNDDESSGSGVRVVRTCRAADRHQNTQGHGAAQCRIEAANQVLGCRDRNNHRSAHQQQP